MAALSLAGLPGALGAHPWWAVKVGLIGIAPGLVLWAALRLAGLRPLPVGLAGLGALVLAGIATGTGKARFAASFAEDWIAGQFWYFGWIAVAAAMTLSLAALVARLWPGRDERS